MPNRTEPGGLWLLNQATDDLTYVETHAESTIASSWPVVDSETHCAIQRGCDWLLNAAGAGFEAYRAALRARWPGDARGLTTDSKPWQFWHRTFYGLSGGATRRLFMGDLDRASRVNGFTIDDSKDGDTVTGWPGGTLDSRSPFTVGQGPGRGGIAESSAFGAGGGGAGTAGERGSPGHSTSSYAVGGLAVSPYYVLHGVTTDNYARDRWLASGSGAAAHASTGQGGAGGASGSGLVRIGLNSITEGTNRTLTGTAGGNAVSSSFGSGGGGGGGVYLAICGGDYTLSSGVTINCDGGDGGATGTSTQRHGGDGGNGHIIIMANGDITLTGTTSNAVVTQWRIITAAPPGGSLISS